MGRNSKIDKLSENPILNVSRSGQLIPCVVGKNGAAIDVTA